MTLLDRHILSRFLANFALLFVLLFVFASAIDIVLNLEVFVDAAHRSLGENAGGIAFMVELVSIMFNFEGPRLFYFYAFLHGLVAIGAMAFTLAQMYRHRELVAILAAGTSLHRVGVPFVLGIFMLSIVQMCNQELMLPRVAPLLLRGHGDVGRKTIQFFPITLVPDGFGRVFHSPEFDPLSQLLQSPTILERDERGRLTRRISADAARWDEAARAWRLTNGRLLVVRPEGGESGEPMAIDLLSTDLSPEILTLRHYEGFSTMLSLRQIGQMLDSKAVRNERALRRHQYARFSAVLVNLLVMVITLPSFLIREPANLLRRSAECSAISMTTLFGAAIFMLMDLPFAPAVGVFLPVVILFPLALGRAAMLKT